MTSNADTLEVWTLVAHLQFRHLSGCAWLFLQTDGDVLDELMWMRRCWGLHAQPGWAAAQIGLWCGVMPVICAELQLGSPLLRGPPMLWLPWQAQPWGNQLLLVLCVPRAQGLTWHRPQQQPTSPTLALAPPGMRSMGCRSWGGCWEPALCTLWTVG